MEFERLSDGSTVNVLSELELLGYEDILSQVLKLSEDTLKVPAQYVSEVVSIASEKVTEMLSVIETPLWLSEGEIEETVGTVVSTVKEVIVRVLLTFTAESVTLIVQFE